MSEKKHTDECLRYQTKMGLAFCGCNCFLFDSVKTLSAEDIFVAWVIMCDVAVETKNEHKGRVALRVSIALRNLIREMENA